MFRLAGALVVIAALGACKNGDVKTAPPPPLPSAGAASAGGKEPVPAGPAVVVHADGHDVVFRVEVARTAPDRQRGLMFREHMDADAGMLFLFERPEQLQFWMRNTLIPLDMVFITTEHRVLGVVENAEPRTETSRYVTGISQFVLEINGGLAARLGIKAGAAVDFVGVN